MKPTIRVSIGGLAFNVEEDAYNVIDSYLHVLRTHFKDNAESSEIIADIESRLSELLQMRINSNDGVVSIEDAQEVIKIMGNPKDFEDDAPSSSDNGDSNNAGEGSSASKMNDLQNLLKKRLFRDVDNKFLGGVCSGLSHYFRIDVVAVRLIFVGIFFLFFFLDHIAPACMSVVFLYIILWIVMPAARTFRQRLSMTGTVSSIESIEDRSQEPVRKYRGSGINTLINVLLNIVVGVVAVITFFTFVGIIAGLIWLLVDSDILGFSNYLVLFGYNTINFKVALFLALLLPVAGLFGLMIKILVRSSFTTKTLISFIIGLVIWLSASVYLVNQGIKFGYSHQDEEEVVSAKSVKADSDTLYVKLGDDYLKAQPLPSNPIMFYRGKSLKERQIVILPSVRMREDTTLTDYKIEVKKKAFAENDIAARRKAESYRLNYSINDSLLTLNPIWYDNDNKWDMEMFEILISTPRNKEIILESPLKEFYSYDRMKLKVDRYNFYYQFD